MKIDEHGKAVGLCRAKEIEELVQALGCAGFVRIEKEGGINRKTDEIETGFPEALQLCGADFT